ncbi:type II toxin-antitoxin system RelE/ParE family toxin [Lichenicoccus sp.]|uniref:type II toxin-antitoxin system RelE/ParE family toxin n=1 Tax=Lichenicoccus sp. TaxID=2781899 RepID=UPI003D0B6B9F
MLHAVLETSIFSRRADALLSAEDRADLIDTLAHDPQAGDVMPGLGGVRKLRFAPKGRGKSGGFRVIYYALTESQPILALLIYGKNEQGDLSSAQRKVVAALAAGMKQGAGS